jgi:hypothetical protein
MELAGLLASLLPGLSDQRLDRGGLLRDGEQRTRAFHDLATRARTGRDPLGRRGGGHRHLCPLTAKYVHRPGVADDGGVHYPLEQRRLGAETQVNRSRARSCPLGDRLKRRRHVAVGEEQLGSGRDDALLGQGDLRVPQGGIDIVS